MGDLSRQSIRLFDLGAFQEIIPITISVENLPQMPPTRYVDVIGKPEVPHHPSTLG
jgi:hypothetical protein